MPESGEQLKAAILKQLEFEKDIITKIGRLALPDLSQEERTLIETEFLSSQDKANELEESVKSAQEAFAKEISLHCRTNSQKPYRVSALQL